MDRCLMLVGGWDGHQPRQCAERLAPLLEAVGLRVAIATDLAALTDPAAMAGLALIVPCWTMGQISGEQSKALRAAVLGGVGLGGWHGGMCDAFRTDTDYQFMTGGQWVAHPGGIVTYGVRLRDWDHPITRGLADFALTSEQYYLHVDPGNQVLATTVFSGSHQDMPWIRATEMPAAWTRRYGAGRVFYSALGHVAADFDNPSVLELTRRGLLWAAGKLA